MKTIASKKQRYFFNDLPDLCTGYIEMCYNLNDTKIYDFCVEYHINGCKMDNKTKQYLLDFFNNF